MTTQDKDYMPLHGLPELAGLCAMQRACQSDWSVEESVERLKRIHYVLKRLGETLVSKITAEPIYELKTAFSHHAYVYAEQVQQIRKRVGEMREPPLGLEQVPHPGLQLAMDEIDAAPSAKELLLGGYDVLLPAIAAACEALAIDAHPLADAPTVRIAKLMAFELQEVIHFGKQAVACLVDAEHQEQLQSWTTMLSQCLVAGQLEGTRSDGDSSGSNDNNAASVSDTVSDLPSPVFSQEAVPYDATPKRDGRFQDPFNAGVNPEAFLYDTRFSARDKTLMMYYKRIRELDVPEMMASILVELKDEEPWEFYYEMVRQLWDEARHAMMGEVGFVSQGLDWTEIPINFTWSRNLNTQLSARERHGVLFFIEQGLMPRTGKRYEWEVGLSSGDPLSGLFQDFDWADEVLHAQIGRRWYVPKFPSLNEALAYGDRCWSKVLSDWQAYQAQGWTEHRNWWPDLYKNACHKWQVKPDPLALAFGETYEDSRADLKKLDESPSDADAS